MPMRINYFLFEKKESNKYLITNELGYYYTLNCNEFDNLFHERFEEIPAQTLQELKNRFFVYEETRDLFLDRAVEEYRISREFLLVGTCLHIFVLTNSCNMNCMYCQAQFNGHTQKGFMSFETAERAVDIALQSPSHTLTFEFQGGEPLLNFSTMKHIVEYTEMIKNDREIKYSVVTNTLLLSDEIIEFFKEYHVSVSTSLDGDIDLHDSNRPRRDGTGTYKNVIRSIEVMRSKGIEVGAIQTTTKNSLKDPEKIVDSYVNADLDCLFIRPLTRLGYAEENWDKIGYSAEEFLVFYKRIFGYLLKINKAGTFISEGHAALFLRKILFHDFGNYMELRSPCGAGVGQLAYYYDGNIYTCDEGRMIAEMGNPAFLLGNVYTHKYDDLMDSDTCKITCQSSILESIPGCCDCVYHPYCGVCPVMNLAMNQNLYARESNNYRCKIYRGILDIIFENIMNGYSLEILNSWAR